MWPMLIFHCHKAQPDEKAETIVFTIGRINCASKKHTSMSQEPLLKVLKYNSQQENSPCSQSFLPRCFSLIPIILELDIFQSGFSVAVLI